MLDRTEFISSVFKRNGTDKFECGYSSIYSKINPNIDTILEIGVHSGASLVSWLEIFPNAKIYGIDACLHSLQILNPKITFIHENVLDVDISLLSTKFDLIIDDGSHYLNDQLTALKNLSGFLSEGGTYVIEDVDSINPEISHNAEVIVSTMRNVGLSSIEEVVINHNKGYHIIYGTRPATEFL